MPSRFCLKLAAIATAVALIVAAIQAWRADRRDRAQIATELAAAKQLLAAADARQHDRDTQLAQTLSALSAQKRADLTPAQIVGELQKNIPLPEPIALQTPSASVPQPVTPPVPQPVAQAFRPEGFSSPTKSTLAKPQSSSQQATMPAVDLKPLYDFTLDCQACQAKLAAAQSDLADEKAKTAALTKERDDALRTAKGGSAWRRAARAAKWLLLGAAAGAIASKAAH